MNSAGGIYTSSLRTTVPLQMGPTEEHPGVGPICNGSISGDQARSEGSALLLAVTFLLLVSAVVVGALTVSDQRWKDERQWERQVAARHLAEAGIDAAIARIRGGEKSGKGEIVSPLGEGRFRVSVDPLSSGRYRVVAVGEYQPDDIVTARATIEAEVAVTATAARVTRWEERR